MRGQTTTKTTKTTRTTTAGKKDVEVMNVSTPINYDQAGETKTFWQSIGKAFKGPKGISVELNALPVNGKMFLSNQKEQTEQAQ